MLRYTVLFCAAAALSAQIVDTSRSPHAKLHGAPVKAVRMGEGFWTPRMRINVERSIPSLLQLLEEHGVVDNFRRVSGRRNVARRGPLYTDSDLYKWMEAVAFVLQSGPAPKLEAAVDSLTDEIAAAQEPSGYLNTYYVDERKPLRFTEMHRGHELYCLGHLLQAGIAYQRATGKRKLLDAGIRFADYLAANFGAQKRPALTGHPELEMALVELYRTTGERRYLDFAGYLLSGVERERLKLRESDVRYMFSGKPFTSRIQFEGHAVRAMYASCGAADYYAETGDAAYRATLDTLWRDMASQKMYITGGVGSRASGEAFGDPYELPNAQAYTESCAAIGNMMWNWRLLLLEPEARYADVIERALYNGINSGMSLDGTLYCYRNPLESSGEKIRNPWYDTTCCPPNLERVLASLPGYLYATSARGVYVNLYHASELDWHLENGTGLKLRQATRYPWDGAVEITVEPAQAAEFSVFLRIPGWSQKTAAAVNGQVVPGVRAGSYLEIRRVWKAGDRVRLDFDVRPRLTAANPLLREDAGRLAVERGPLVYCLEKHDNGALASLFDAALDTRAGFREERRDDLLGGMVVLRHAGSVSAKPLSGEPLYAPFSTTAPAARPADLTFIPYYGWANRAPAEMQVWVSYR
jgi:DUF1680 family protein